MIDLPVLFIHGFPFDSAMWRHQIAALSNWKRVVPDLWGAGLANIPASAGPYSIADQATSLVGTLDDLLVDDVVVCGQSMGGYIAFELLRAFPTRVRAAILCNTKATADTAEAKRGRDTMAAKAEREGPGALAAELVPKLLARATLERQPAVVREVTTMIERQPVYGMVVTLRALRDRPDSTPSLGQIRIPVLVVAGDEDQIAPAAGMEEMARAIPGAQFTVIPGSGHLSPLEQPQAVNAALNAFLAQL
jgi:pimeloyl-ACP methyl ester carboxylesterase